MDISKFFSTLRLDSEAPVPLYIQIGEFILGLIEEKVLFPHSKLPPERELSDLLGVSRTTAINAYRYLEKKGVAQTRVGSGTYITEQDSERECSSMPWNQLYRPFPQTSQGSILRELVSSPYTDDHISLAAGMPNPSFYPLEIINSLLSTISSACPRDFGHIPTEGYPPLKVSITNLLADKDIVVQPEEVMIVSGSQQGLYLLTKAFVEPSDYVIVESPTYIGAIQTFQMAGARLLTVPYSDRLDLELIEDYLIRYRPKLFYIMPTFHNPTGRVLSLEERKRLIQLAARHRLTIIEDDAYGDLYYSSQKPPASLKALDSYGGVIYLGTFSKILFPGLRTGWVVAPNEVIKRLSLEKQYTDLHSNNLTQWLLTQYVNEGLLHEHLKKVRGEYKIRRDALVQAIGRFCAKDFRFVVPDGGFYLWCTLQSSFSSSLLLYEAARRGVSYVPGEVFYTGPQNLRQIRLCFTTHSPQELAEGIKRLSVSLKEATKKSVGNNNRSSNSLPII
ncbi:MAG: PLP-dependent aminotransferase family protein [Peptococcaceae bacterium]|nr:PLP-dependent aminotransferase family protein [Peptococcaceae bacterium]